MDPLTRRQRRHAYCTMVVPGRRGGSRNGTVNSLESLIEHAEERMHCSGIEQGEIDIQ